jgi:O-antigen/teichoic acid export membrane protein
MTIISGILIVIAQPLIILLWGKAWEGSVIAFQLLLLASVIGYVQSLTLVLLQIVNKTGYTLKLEFLKKPVYLIVIFLSIQFGLIGLLVAYVINSLWGTIVNMSAPQKYISYSYFEQFKDVFVYGIAWLVGSLLVWGYSLLIHPCNIVDILLRMIIMLVIYVGVLCLVKDDVFMKYSKQIYVTGKNKFAL